MKMLKKLKKCIGVSLLMPLMGFAASTTINDWGFEPNGDVRAVVGEETVYVSSQDESEYFQALMAARLHWPVELVNGHIVVDASAVPASELSAITTCTGATCPFDGVTYDIYSCLLGEMEQMILNPPPPATAPGKITSWPTLVEGETSNVGVVSFTMPPFIGPFTINVNWNEPALVGQIVAKPTKPVVIPDSVIWGYVEAELNGCKAGK
ncbi:MAG: hypothetical protein ACHQAX_09685 [Gammaproteobacteria bacterium]